MHELGAVAASRVGRSARRQRRVEEAAARPVGLEQVVEELSRIGIARVKLDADRRAAAEITRRRQRVDVVGRVLSRSVAISVVAVEDLVHRAHLAVPRQADVPLHVAVEEECLTSEVIGKVVRVSVPPGEDSELLRVRHPVEDGAVRALARALAEVGEVGQELRVLVPEDRRRQIERRIGNRFVVADDERDAAVRAATDRMRSVLLNRSRHRQRFERIGHIVAVRVFEAEDAGAIVDVRPAAAAARGRRGRCRHLFGSRHHRARRVQGPAFEPEALTIADFVADHFLGLVNAVLVVVEKDSREVLLLRDDEPAETVEGDDHVTVALVGRVDALDGKARQCAELHAGDGLRNETRLIRRLSERPSVQNNDGGRHEHRTHVSRSHD